MPVQDLPVNEAEELLLEHWERVERAAVRACRRRHLGWADTEDFVSRVKVKLCDNDYQVIRRYKGRSGAKFSTYLTSVVQNEILDYLDHLYGKWRPSAAAKRLGSVAVELDRLLTRDGFTFDEACQILSTRHGEAVDPGRLEEIAARLPQRTRRPVQDSEPVPHLSAQGKEPDEHLLEQERGAARRQVLQMLHEALKGLLPEDRLLVKMVCDRTVAQISRALRLEQKPLYRRLEKIYHDLRQELERRGVTQETLAEILRAAPLPEEGEEPARDGEEPAGEARNWPRGPSNEE